MHLALSFVSESWKPRLHWDIFDGIVPAAAPASGPRQGFGPAASQISRDMDHNLLVQARRVSLNLERAGTPCQSSLPGSSAVHRGFAQRVRSATCAQRLLSLTPRSRVRRYIDVPPARTVGQPVNSYASEPYLCMLHFAYITHHQKVWNMLTSGSPFAAYSAPAFAISVKRSAQQ